MTLMMGVAIMATHLLSQGGPYPPNGVMAEVKQVDSSWYGREFQGKRMANGERFDRKALTAAHPSIPLGTEIELINPDNGKIVRGVVVKDRGPYVSGRGLDVSEEVADMLGFREEGHHVLLIRIVW